MIQLMMKSWFNLHLTLTSKRKLNTYRANRAVGTVLEVPKCITAQITIGVAAGLAIVCCPIVAAIRKVLPKLLH